MDETIKCMLESYVKYGSMEAYKVLMKMFTPLLFELLEDSALSGIPREVYTKALDVLQDSFDNYPCDGRNGEDWIHEYVEAHLYPYLNELNSVEKTDFTEEEIEQYTRHVERKLKRIFDGDEKLFLPYSEDAIQCFKEVEDLLSVFMKEMGGTQFTKDEFYSFAMSFGYDKDVLLAYDEYYKLRGRQLCEGVPVKARLEVQSRIEDYTSIV